MSVALGMQLGMSFDQHQEFKPEVPEFDDKKFRSLVDIIAKASEKKLEDHITNLPLLKEIEAADIEYRRKNQIYMLDTDQLEENYFGRCRYMVGKVNSRKVDIRFLGKIQRKEIDDIVRDFETENSVELDIKKKKLRGMTYDSISHEGVELARVFNAKLSFVHDRFKIHPDKYKLGLDLVTKLASEIHDNDLLDHAEKITYSDFMGPLYLSIPGWFKKDYVLDAVEGMQMFLDSKNSETMVPNIMQDGSVPAKSIFAEASKKPGCYFVKNGFKKRHIEYIFADEKGGMTVKLDCQIDKTAVQRRIRHETQVYAGKKWVNESLIPIGVSRDISAEGGTLETRVLPGSHLLVGTLYSSINLNFRNNKIYAEGVEKPLVTFGDRTVSLRPKSEYAPNEYRMAVAVANAVYEQMLFYTESTITRKGTTACAKPDELNVVKAVSKIANEFVGRSDKRYSERNAIRMACDEYIRAVKKAYNASLVKKHGFEGEPKK